MCLLSLSKRYEHLISFLHTNHSPLAPMLNSLTELQEGPVHGKLTDE